MTTKDLKRPRGCSRSNVYRLAKLARQERYGGNCTTPTAFVAKEEQLIPPVLQHFQGKRWSGIASTKHHKLLLDAVTTPTGSKPYKVKMHRATDDLQLAYRCQRPLEQLSDIPSSDATDKMDRGGKRKRQPIDRSDFTCEVEEKRKHAVYEVDIDYSPPPPQLENMSHACSSPKRWTLGSMENLPTFSNPIASSPPAAHSEAMCKNDTVKEVRQLKGVIADLVLQNIRVREELHALRLEVNALRFQHAASGTSSAAQFPARFPHVVHRGHATAKYEAGRSGSIYPAGVYNFTDSQHAGDLSQQCRRHIHR